MALATDYDKPRQGNANGRGRRAAGLPKVQYGPLAFKDTRASLKFAPNVW